MKATKHDISSYFDDIAAGFEAGPVGTPEFQEAVRENQERRSHSQMDEPELAVLVDSLTLAGGGFKALPSGRVEVFLPVGTGWRRRYYDKKSGEKQSAAVRRALALALQAKILEDLDGEAAPPLD